MLDSPSLLLTGFADEAADNKTMDQQFSVMSALGLEYFTIRFIDVGTGIKNVMALDDTEVKTIRQRMLDYGLSVSSIGSPLGKVKLVDIDDGTVSPYRPIEQYLQHDVPRICEIAHQLDSKLIRGFSFYHPQQEPLQKYLPQATDYVGRIAEICRREGLLFGLEVEANLVGQTGWILAEMHQSIANESLVLIFDGANLVMQGFDEEQIFQQYTAMKPGLGWIHIKDLLSNNKNQQADDAASVRHIDEEKVKNFVPADQGSSGHRRILSDFAEFLPNLHQRMIDKGAAGVFADLEPHLKGGGQFGGFSGADGFGVALRSFCELCQEVGIDYRLRGFGDIIP